MLILGTAAAIVSQRVEWGTPDSDLHFTVVQFGDMLMFGCVAGAGIYLQMSGIST